MQDYRYVNCEEGTSQYDSIVFQKGEPVDAIYVPATLAVDRGNPLIEALPPFRSEGQIDAVYTRSLLGYDRDAVKSMSLYAKISQIRDLRRVRFPMLFHARLEQEFHSLLVSSLRARSFLKSKNDCLTVTVGNEVQNTDRILIGEDSDSTSAGFSLTGFSGCGKSAAISILVSNYPQVIRHRDRDGNVFHQITYIVVNCVPGNNFNALYTDIGRQIDRALGNIKPVYQLLISKKKGLGEKAATVCSLIEQFSIGVIIFDEIQYIRFNSQEHENSFDSLLNITNKTKVGLVAVGTEEARDKMFKTQRVARRLGRKIDGQAYCENREFFKYLVQQLFQYQWFDEPIPLTDELVDAFYSVTRGIVDQLISTYMYVSLDYVQKKKKPVVNGEYVKSIATRYYPNILRILETLDTHEIDEKLRLSRSLVDKKIDDLLNDSAIQNTEAARLMAHKEENANRDIQLRNIIASINSIFEYPASQIEEAYIKIIKRKNSSEKSEKEITKEVLLQLEKTRKTRSNAREDHQHPSVPYMESFLGVS